MVTICVLFGILGHFIGSTGRPSRSVRATLYPTTHRGFSQSNQSFSGAAKLSAPTPRRDGEII
jgi:hypothetical protein